MSRLRITPVGTCRIHTPLKRAVARYPIELDLRRNYGFVHASGEALQMVQFLQGESNFAAEVAPLIFRYGDFERYSAESWEPADLHIVEISSAKRVTCGSAAVQLNYLTTYFADFFASSERARQFWSLLRNRDRRDLLAFVHQQQSYRMMRREDRELLLTVSMQQQSFSSIKADMAEITERLGKDRLVFVTHLNGRASDGSLIPVRDRLIRWVKLAAEQLEVQCFDPTDHLQAFGQDRALEQDGLDLTHYTPAFADHLYDAMHRSHVAALLSGNGEGPEDPDRQHAILAAQFEAMLQVGDFVKVAREVHEALRKAPDALPLIELRGLIRAQIGDYPAALDDLTRRGDDTSMSEPMRLALLDSLQKVGDDERALKIAENLIADEFETADIYRVAAGAAERLGNFERAVAHAKQAFRRDRSDLAAALHALRLLNEHGRPEESSVWRDEILENVDAFATGSFHACEWAISHRDEKLFKAAVPGVVATDKGAAIDLLELALNAGLFHSSAFLLELLGKIGELARHQNRRRNEVASRAADEASRLFSEDRLAEAFELARAAGSFRVALARSRALMRDISARVGSLVRDAYLRGDHKAVIAAAEGLDDIFVGNARLVLLVARSLAAEGQGDEALALLKKANAENPDDFSLRRWAGRLAAQHGDYATALRMYSSLDKRDPEFPSAKRDVERFFAGVELRGVRKLRELLDSDQIDAALDLAHELSARTGAGEACERFLTRKHRSLRVRLIEIEQGEGDLDEREPILAQMLRIKAEDEFALRRLALEFTRQFRFAEAAECWERVHELDPDSETAIRNRDRCRVLAQRKTSISKAA